jgi:hypothetical protein
MLTTKQIFLIKDYQKHLIREREKLEYKIQDMKRQRRKYFKIKVV